VTKANIALLTALSAGQVSAQTGSVDDSAKAEGGAFAGFRETRRNPVPPERLQGAGQIEQRDAFVDGNNDAACFGRAHNTIPGWQLSRDICHCSQPVKGANTLRNGAMRS
jgi:hypothetical protein